MGKETLCDKFKEFIGGIAFSIFLWSAGMTGEEYWHQVYVEEAMHLEPDEDAED
jgi:hypothetical protein